MKNRMDRKQSYQCKSCGRHFKSLNALKQHMKKKHTRSFYLPKILASLSILIIIVSFIMLTYHPNESINGQLQTSITLMSSEDVFIGEIIKGRLDDKAVGLVLEDRDCEIVSGLQLTCTAVIQVAGQKLHIRYTHDMSKQPCLKFGDKVLIEPNSPHEVTVKRVYRA